MIKILFPRLLTEREANAGPKGPKSLINIYIDLNLGNEIGFLRLDISDFRDIYPGRRPRSRLCRDPREATTSVG